MSKCGKLVISFYLSRKAFKGLKNSNFLESLRQSQHFSKFRTNVQKMYVAGLRKSHTQYFLKKSKISASSTSRRQVQHSWMFN